MDKTKSIFQKDRDILNINHSKNFTENNRVDKNESKIEKINDDFTYNS